MRNLIIALLVALTPLPALAARELPSSRIAEGINRSLVRIGVTFRDPNFYLPWQYKTPQARIGSGFVIAGNRIITNAHIVDNGVFIEVKKANDPKKYQGRIVAVGYQCDLALITVDDPSFFKGVRPLPFGPLPSLLDTVTAFGFPQGGNEVSLTRGVVSRIEQIRYSFSGVELLAVQIDAAINPGNSGGPVIDDGHVAGVAMQALTGGDNIGYIIPTPIIEHFLADVQDGVYHGFPSDGIVVQDAENPALREAHGLGDGDHGLLVDNIIFGSSADGVLKPGDVLTQIDGVSLADDGTVPLTDAMRVDANYLVQKHQVGETMSVGYIRDGAAASAKMTLKKDGRMVPKVFGSQPSYLIYGGLIFTPLTINLLEEWGRNWYRDAPPLLIHLAQDTLPEKDRSQIVIIRGVLAHGVNVGYHTTEFAVVKKIDGVPIGSMADLVAALDTGESPFVTIILEGELRIVLRRDEVAKATPLILQRYGVPAPFSPDMAPRD